jgi:hypothetical protein
MGRRDEQGPNIGSGLACKSFEGKAIDSQELGQGYVAVLDGTGRPPNG